MGQKIFKLKKFIPWLNRIKVRVLFFGILMAIIPLAPLGYFYVKAAEENLLASIQRRSTDMVTHVAADTEQLISEIQEIIASAGNLNGSQLLQVDLASQEQVLFTLLRDIPSAEVLSLFDSGGRETARVSRREVTDPKQLTQLAPELLSQQGIIDSYLASDGRPMVSLVVPFRDLSTQQVNGGFLVQVNLRPIIAAAAAGNGSNEGEIFVVSRQGKLMGHEDFSQVLRQAPVASSLAVRLFMEGKPAPEKVPLRYQSYAGKEVFGFYAPIKEVGWGAVVEIPVSEAYKPVTSLIARLFLVTAAVIVLVVVAGMHFAARFTKPIEALEEGARRIGQGQFDLTLPGAADDEIGKLVETFNEMARQLKLKKEMEAFVLRTEKMAALGLLSAGVAHEINNPLATVAAYAEDLLDRIKHEDMEELNRSGQLAEYLQVIQQQTERGKKITGSLLSFARQPVGQISPVDLNQLLEDTLALLRYRLKHQGIEVAKKLAPGLPPVKGDLSQLQQVLLNILGNSLDAMEAAGGQLQLETAKTDGYVAVKITDTGTGIPPEQLAKVFDPFYTTKPVGKGTGLGLSICYGIIKEMQGDIQISSQPGKGTSVSLLIPAYTGA